MKNPLVWNGGSGKKPTSLYRRWSGMRSRCYNKNNHRYPLYGARGIRICDDWLFSFSSFASWALENGYKEGLSIDRIDNDKSYSPDNCRWITLDEQKRNRRFCHKVEYKGRKFDTLQDAADFIGISQNTLTQRIKRGWPMDLVMGMPLFKGRAPAKYDKIIQERKSNRVRSNSQPQEEAPPQGGSQGGDGPE